MYLLLLYIDDRARVEASFYDHLAYVLFSAAIPFDCRSDSSSLSHWLYVALICLAYLNPIYFTLIGKVNRSRRRGCQRKLDYGGSATVSLQEA